MKILMVCTHPGGGATIAARRQAEALRRAGEQCHLVSIREGAESQDIHVTREADDITINVSPSSWSYSGRLTLAYCDENRTDVSNTWFSFWPCETFLDRALLEICLQYDVIHFHWTAQIISSRFLAELARHNCRIVVTSHDMNHFTGGCHYSAGCDRYKKECTDCPHLRVDPLDFVVNSFYQKISAFARLPITWLFPSKWLSEAFGESRLQDNPAANKVLYNCIDIERFRYPSEQERITQRSAFGFSEHEMVFVAGSVDNTEKRKGFDYIVHGIRQLSLDLDSRKREKGSVTIVTFGSGKPELGISSSRVRHLHLGTIDESTVLRIFQSSDVMVIPSTEENFANTILECLMCGCPVLAFRIGGVPDIVEHGRNGWIVNDVDYDAFSDRLISLANADLLLQMRQSTQDWRDKEAAQYGYPFIAAELLNVYRNTEDTTGPRSIEVFSKIEPSDRLYEAIFGPATWNNTHSHCLLAANVSRLVALSTGKPSSSARDNVQLTIPAIFKGFSNVVKHAELGHVAWLLKRAFVMFKPGNGAVPALCIQVPNVKWVVDGADRSLSSICASLNGTEAEVRCIKPAALGKYVYIWIIPEPGAVVPGKFNTLDLTMDISSVEEHDDPRGLCILHYQATVFNLQEWIDFGAGLAAPDYATSTALALKATQSQYLWDGWTDQANADAALPNVVGNWIDLVRGCSENTGSAS